MPGSRRWLSTGLRVIERLLAIVGLCMIIYCTFFDLSVIGSGSMAPALQGENVATGDRVLFEKFTGRFRAPRRWEIHQFHTPEGITAAKRVVGLPGERVSLRDGVLHIDGKPVEIPAGLQYLRYYPFGNLVKGHEVDCASGYYVLGDDSRDSMDSRYNGVLSADQFTGRAWLTLGPGRRYGFVR
ncbi:MAG: signal peptidase I [Rariglobus sp.]|nr:signal peptidase I [Rariglobus sp.]